MTNSSQGIIRPSRWQIALLALVAAGLALALALPGSASAGTVSCHGQTRAVDPATAPPIRNPLGYVFTCNERIISYSIVANRAVDYFDPEVEVFIGNPEKGNVSSEAFSCEGPIPGNGFGCTGSAAAPNAEGPRVVDGSLALNRNACRRHARGAGFRAWLIVTTVQTNPVNQKMFTISSEPFRLAGPGCKKAAKKPARQRAR